MKQKIIHSLAAALLFAILLLFSSCRLFDSNIVGTTSQGTPIVECDITDLSWEKTPDSSCFSEIAYDINKHILYVRFRDSGAAYRYLDFPKREWNDFREQESLGEWYNKNIKGTYQCEKLAD